MKHVGGRDVVGVHQRLRRRPQAAAVPAPRERHRRRSTQAAEQVVADSAKPRRARWTSDCPRRVRSRSSRSTSIAASPERSASRWVRSRSRCGPRSPGSTRAIGRIPSGEMRDVQVRLAPESRRNARRPAPAAARGAWDPNGAPTTLPLGQVATITQGVGPAIIDHLDRDLVVTVEANTSGRATGDVTADIVSARREAARCRRACGSASAATRRRRTRCSAQIFIALVVAVRADVPDSGAAVRLASSIRWRS